MTAITGAAPVFAGRRRALIVATDEYTDRRLQTLRSPAHDVQDLARVLRDDAIGAFEVDVVRNAPEHQVRRRIDAFFRTGMREEVLMLHLSCHGVKDDYGHLYFATADTELDSLDSTAVAADWLRRQIDRSRSGSIVVQLDCCYSGAFTSGARHRGAHDVVDVRSQLGGERPHGRGCIVLTASSSTEYAFEGDHRSGQGEASVFTRAVVAGMETGDADLDGDGLISVDELYDFVFEKVRNDTARQTPGKWADVRGDIVIARSLRGPRTHDAPTLLPADVLIAMGSPRPSARAGAVADLAELLPRSDRALADAARRALDELATDHSPVVSAAALAAVRGQRFTWVQATRASRIALWIGAVGVLLLLLANATRLHEGGDETLSGSMFAYQTLGAAAAAAAVALAFLGSRTSAQLTIGALVGVAAASGIGAALALIDVGGDYIVPRFPGRPSEVLFEGSNGLAQRYDAYLLWMFGAIALLVAGLVLATLAFGVRSPARQRWTAQPWIAADVVVVTGAAAVLAGVLAAPEAFAPELSSVRLGPGEGHGWQPLILAAAAIGIVATERLLSREFRPALRGLILGLAWVAFLYCLGVVQLIRGPGRPSPGILVALVGAAIMVIAAVLAVMPLRGRVPRVRAGG